MRVIAKRRLASKFAVAQFNFLLALYGKKQRLKSGAVVRAVAEGLGFAETAVAI